MDAPKDINEALLAFQADPPVLTKDKAAHQSKYADLVQVNRVVLAKLNALGITWTTLPTLLDDGKFVLDYELKHVASETTLVGRWPLKLSENPQQMGSQVTYARRYSLLAITGVAAEDEDDDGNAASGRQYAQRAAQRPRQQRPADEPAEGGRTAQRGAQRPAGARPPLPGEDADPDGKVEQKQMRHMHALWNELGFGGEENRDNRLTITAKILGLPDLESSSNLTRGQADQVITALRERKERTTAGEPQ
jgi:hypothetical protein